MPTNPVYLTGPVRGLRGSRTSIHKRVGRKETGASIVPVTCQALVSSQQPSEVTLLAHAVDVGREAQRGYITCVRPLSWKKKSWDLIPDWINLKSLP